jgi:hypothetical protein
MVFVLTLSWSNSGAELNCGRLDIKFMFTMSVCPRHSDEEAWPPYRTETGTEDNLESNVLTSKVATINK